MQRETVFRIELFLLHKELSQMKSFIDDWRSYENIFLGHYCAGIFICIFFVVGGSAYAEGGSKIDVFFHNIKMMFDGVEKKPDEGKVFVYENLTYVPLRFVSESLGKEVAWNEETQTIWIGTQESKKKEQAEQATKIINHGLENADKLRSYSMKVNGSILVGDEGFKIGVETGLDASVIRKPETIISGERSLSIFGKPISRRYYFTNNKLFKFSNKWSESKDSISSIFSHDTFDPQQVLKAFLSSPEPIRIDSTPEGMVLQTGGSGEKWKSHALDFFLDSDKPTEEAISVRQLTFKLLVDGETSLPVRLEIVSDIVDLDDGEPRDLKSTVTVSYNELNKIQSIPVPEGL